MNEEKAIIREVQKSLVKGGFKVPDFQFNLEPRTAIIVKLTRLFEPDRWDEIRIFLRSLGFYYVREKREFVRGIFQ